MKFIEKEDVDREYNRFLSEVNEEYSGGQYEMSIELYQKIKSYLRKHFPGKYCVGYGDIGDERIDVFETKRLTELGFSLRQIKNILA